MRHPIVISSRGYTNKLQYLPPLNPSQGDMWYDGRDVRAYTGEYWVITYMGG